MRRHYLDAEEIAALLDTSGRRGEAEEAPAPWRVGGSMRRLGLTRKTSISSEWPEISLQQYDPSVRFTLLFSQHWEHVGVMFSSVLSSKSQQRQKVEHCFLVPPKPFTILWFLTWRAPVIGCALSSLDLWFYRTFSDRGLRPPWSCNYSKSIYEATSIMFLLFDVAGTYWKYV